MIPSKFRSFEIVGRTARTLVDIYANDHVAIKAGSIVVITEAHYGCTIRTQPCTQSGVFYYAKKVRRSALELVDDGHFPQAQDSESGHYLDDLQVADRC